MTYDNIIVSLEECIYNPEKKSLSLLYSSLYIGEKPNRRNPWNSVVLSSKVGREIYIVSHVSGKIFGFKWNNTKNFVSNTRSPWWRIEYWPLYKLEDDCPVEIVYLIDDSLVKSSRDFSGFLNFFEKKVPLDICEIDKDEITEEKTKPFRYSVKGSSLS